MAKLGLVAGGGALPVHLALHCRANGRAVFVVRLAGARQPELDDFDSIEVGIGQFGRAVDALKGAKCASVCLAGSAPRPDFASLRPDARGLVLLPGALAAAKKGDGALLNFMLDAFEKAGLRPEGAQEVMADLLLTAGRLGSRAPTRADRRDIERAVDAARAIGGLDIGQAAVSCRGLVLALEAQEGTDEMLRRIARLPPAVRGAARSRRGVLAKMCKANQDRRVDLPTIGPQTVDLAAAAGLAGIVGEAGGLLVLDREGVAAKADAAGLFVHGLG